MASGVSGGTRLPGWIEPDRFLTTSRYPNGLDVLHLSCLSHAIYDVLRGHGVSDPLVHVVQPICLVWHVDRTFRPWLLTVREERFDTPCFSAGLRASWRLAPDLRSLSAVLDDLFASGRVAILRSFDWQVPWIAQSDLMPADTHVVVATAWDGDRLALANRGTGARVGEAHNQWLPLEDLETSVGELGMAVLDYDLASTPTERPELLAGLVRSSILNLTGAGHRPSSTEYGLRAIHLMRRLFAPANLRLLDSRFVRSLMRWQLPACIDKYVIGNRVVFDLFLASGGAGTEAAPETPEVRTALRVDVAAWQQLREALARAARLTSFDEASLPFDAVLESELGLARALAPLERS